MAASLPTASDFEHHVLSDVSSYLPPTTWKLGCTLALVIGSTYILDYGLKVYRDKRMQKFGSPAPLVALKAPLGIDVAIYSLYRFFTNTYFELISGWLASVPGRTVEVRMFGEGLIITEEPANIRAIMSTEWSSFGKGETTRRIWENMIGEAQIFAIDGDLWHKAKDTLRPHVGQLRPSDLRITEQHVGKLFARLDSGQAIELYDVIDRYQLDVTAHVFFGESAESLTSEPPFRAAMEKLLPLNTARMIFGHNAFYVPDTLLAPAALRDLNAYTNRITDQAYAKDLSKKPKEEYNMLEDLVSQKRSYKDIKESLMSVMLGGKDPSTIIISWALFQMGNDPNVMRKMSDEVTRICGSSPPTASKLKEMTYVRAVISEVFRLYHPLGVNMRLALNDVTLPTGGGKTGKEPLAIAKGTSIMYSLMGMQRRKDIYGEDADVFRPERWLETSVDRWHFIPYNHGPRVCLGRNFGQQQMEYILARICQEYEEIMIPAGQRQQQIKIELNCKMAHPCMARFVRKKSLSKTEVDGTL
ncbi:cytochrome P450 [Stachybotrys elegans]|uniref:Cytochrome P450 n=1 Tax=Stachybotrys elegans TaxID=80388 RepID=A0A8K0T3W0_9HYPO|nr:cytochrome P450 [Stachybotrys elegans]